MKVVPSGQTSHTAHTQFIVPLNRLPRLDSDGRKMRVEGVHPEAVINDYAISLDAKIVCPDYLPGIGRQDRHVCCDCQVES